MCIGVTTNGVIESKEFLDIYKDFMEYVECPSKSRIMISKDRFHAFSSGLSEEEYEEKKQFFENNGSNTVVFQNVEKTGIYRVGRIEKQPPIKYDPRLSLSENSIPRYAYLLGKDYNSRLYTPIRHHGNHICVLYLTVKGRVRFSDIISNSDEDNCLYDSGHIKEGLSNILMKEGKDPYCMTLGAFLEDMSNIESLKTKINTIQGFLGFGLYSDMNKKILCIKHLLIGIKEITDHAISLLPQVYSTVDTLPENERKNISEKIKQTENFNPDEIDQSISRLDKIIEDRKFYTSLSELLDASQDDFTSKDE